LFMGMIAAWKIVTIVMLLKIMFKYAIKVGV